MVFCSSCVGSDAFMSVCEMVCCRVVSRSTILSFCVRCFLPRSVNVCSLTYRRLRSWFGKM